MNGQDGQITPLATPRANEVPQEGMTAEDVSRQLGHIADQAALGMHQLLTQQRELSEQLENTRRQMVQGRVEGARYQTRAIALGEELTQERQHRTALQEFIQALIGQAQARDALVQSVDQE
eukprot:4847279-Amphidinium_carterae.3